MKLVIDRIEEKLVVCENPRREMITLPLDIFPDKIKEGDIIIYQEGEIRIDSIATEQQKKKMEDKMNRLFRK